MAERALLPPRGFSLRCFCQPLLRFPAGISVSGIRIRIFYLSVISGLKFYILYVQHSILRPLKMKQQRKEQDDNRCPFTSLDFVYFQ